MKESWHPPLLQMMLDLDPYQFVQTTKHKDDTNKQSVSLNYDLNQRGAALGWPNIPLVPQRSADGNLMVELCLWLFVVMLFLLRHSKGGTRSMYDFQVISVKNRELPWSSFRVDLPTQQLDLLPLRGASETELVQQSIGPDCHNTILVTPQLDVSNLTFLHIKVDIN